jgi:hypothetical protein
VLRPTAAMIFLAAHHFQLYSVLLEDRGGYLIGRGDATQKRGRKF